MLISWPARASKQSGIEPNRLDGLLDGLNQSICSGFRWNLLDDSPAKNSLLAAAYGTRWNPMEAAMERVKGTSLGTQPTD